MQAAPTKRMRFKLNFVVLPFMVLLAVYIAVKLFGVSILQSDMLKALANSQQMQSISIGAHRGTIYDRNNKVLAQSVTVWQVILSPRDLYIYEKDNIENEIEDRPSREDICKKLSEILEVDYENLLERSKNTKNAFYIVKRKVEKETIDKLNQYLTENTVASNAVYTIEESKREYPNGSLLSTVLGFTNYDDDGVYGIEAYYNDYLKGVDGKIMFAKDKDGNQMPVANDIKYDAVDGNSIQLTIDEVLQYYVEKYLELAVTENKVQERATAIIMNVNTGAILAMATTPSFDPNSPGELYSQTDKEYIAQLKAAAKDEEALAFVESEEARLRERQWKNKAITELYYPGSVFKTVTGASALDEETVSLESTFNCSGSENVAGTRIKCWRTSGHGTLDFTQAMVKSCNPSFIKIGQSLGVSSFVKYFKAFGFAEKTGIDLPGEAQSLYVKEEDMGPVELASSSFGQTNKVTAIQMITAFAAVVNGGKLVTPYIVDKIIDNNGNVIKTTQPTVKRQVISEETSETMRKVLEEVVVANGGNNAYITGYRLAGKSGTSEKIDKKNETGTMYYVSTFASAAPANNPEIAMLVIADEPTGGQFYGSAVAAPVVSAVFKEGLPYLGIHPQYTAEELEDMATTVPYLVGLEAMRAESNLTAKGLVAEFVGSRDGVVTKYYPSTGDSIPKGGKVVIYMGDEETQKSTVPNVVGMTLEEANIAITDAGFNMMSSGGAVNNADAKAVSQSVSAGSKVPKGTVIEVKFIVNDETG
ncbi:MAG: PASTA domain-containing protein [Clostridiales bacterium]|mgnify:FL=1|nr:PASTA domain-containing protein [Clostridiales bacterium]